MIRDFVAGVLWGGVVAGVGLGVISQVSPLPRERGALTAPDAPMPDAPVPDAIETPVAGNDTMAAVPELPSDVAAEDSAAASEIATSDAEATDAPVPEPDASPEAEIAPAETAPTPDAVAETAPEDAEDGAVPAPVEMPDPQKAAPSEPDMLAEADAMPMAPQQDEAAPAVVTPGQAPAPAEPEGPVAAVPAPAPATPLAPAPEAQLAPETGSTPAAPASEAESSAPRLPDIIPAPEAEAPPAGAELPPAAAPAPKDTLLEPAPAAEPAPKPGEIVPDPALPMQSPERIVPDASVTLAPDPGLKMGVTADLPAIGGGSPDKAASDAPAADAPPVQRFAARFENPGAKPLFAILLLDPGTPDLDRVRLAALPFPVTFVLDPQAANVAEAAATYRAAGKEVVMLATGIPAGATASDLEQTFQSNGANLPEAVAVMDLPDGGFQDDRPLATQLVPIVKAEGRGLLTFDRGLNAADQVARREDVPAAVIFRRLDAEGEDLPVIRRYLDRAAFKAAQEGRVAVLGEAKPETIAAILEWTVEGRASSVALAPATAVLAVE